MNGEVWHHHKCGGIVKVGQYWVCTRCKKFVQPKACELKKTTPSKDAPTPSKLTTGA